MYLFVYLSICVCSSFCVPVLFLSGVDVRLAVDPGHGNVGLAAFVVILHCDVDVFRSRRCLPMLKAHFLAEQEEVEEEEKEEDKE